MSYMMQVSMTQEQAVKWHAEQADGLLRAVQDKAADAKYAVFDDPEHTIAEIAKMRKLLADAENHLQLMQSCEKFSK